MAALIVVGLVITLVIGVCSVLTRKRLVRELKGAFPSLARDMALDKDVLSRGPRDTLRFVKFILDKRLWPTNDEKVKPLLETARRLDIAYYFLFASLLLLLVTFLR